MWAFWQKARVTIILHMFSSEALVVEASKNQPKDAKIVNLKVRGE